jgi:hypothetical protein
MDKAKQTLIVMAIELLLNAFDSLACCLKPAVCFTLGTPCCNKLATLAERLKWPCENIKSHAI